MRSRFSVAAFLSAAAFMTGPAAADVFTFSTGDPTNQIGTASRPASAGKIETESADDFVLNANTQINSATFTGLVTGASPTIGEVRVEIYRVFPKDSTDPPSGNVLTRVNSPSDVEFADRDTASNNLTFTTTTVNASFTALNSVLNGINKFPNQTTGGEGPVTGAEVRFNVTFTTPLILPTDHYFFVPQVEVAGGEFYWLSAPRPIVAPGTPFPPGSTDLQSWIRNENLAPDWSRIGTDVVGNTMFNASFSLDGFTAPEPSAMVLTATGLVGLVGYTVRGRRRSARSLD